MIKNIEKTLKRYLKRKVSFTEATAVIFLITGAIGLGATETIYTRFTTSQILDSSISDLILSETGSIFVDYRCFIYNKWKSRFIHS